MNSDNIKTKDTAIAIERTLNAPLNKVWKAITDKDQMKQWYFDLPEFKAEPGFEFQFLAGSDEKKYLHVCKVTAVVVGKKISYSWHYKGYPGNSIVTFELFEEGDLPPGKSGKTRIKLTHEGLESFVASKNPDFDKKNFVDGWTQIIGTSLKEFVEKA